METPQSVEARFLEKFGPEQLAKVKLAAAAHTGETDFRKALLVCVGYECVSCSTYKEWHGIEIDYIQFSDFLKTVDFTEDEALSADCMAFLDGAFRGLLKADIAPTN